MQQPKDIAIAALKKMLAQVGADAEFPGDAIWQYADEDVDALRKPPVFKMLSTDGYIEDTGEKTNAVTPDRRSAPTTKYRFGPLLRPTYQITNAEPSLVAKAFSASCNNVLQVKDTSCIRLCASLLSKRFVILTGLSGSGKTKLAQAFARWITPSSIAADPFKVGSKIQGASKEYTIVKSGAQGIELDDAGKIVFIPMPIILEWAAYIEKNSIPDTVSSRELRDKIEAESKFTPHLHRQETHYKPMAFELVKARRNPQPVKCYEVIPVGADWTGDENIVGYPDGLCAEKYVTRAALELIRQAIRNENVPHFLILDEMNLSHVERYFADLLSALESTEEIPLYEAELTDDGQKKLRSGVPDRLKLPDNLFIIGTVNVDETTYMFSPKVLDRANVIEFRMDPTELAKFLDSPKAVKLEELDSHGTQFAKDFVASASDTTRGVATSVKAEYAMEMGLFFNMLREHNAEFGYRTAYEAARFVHFYKLLGGYPDDKTDWFKGAMDCIIVQKFLPKLHGSRSKLEGLLWALAWACGAERKDRDGKAFALQLHEASLAQDEGKYGPETVWSALTEQNKEDPAKAARYPLSFDKVMRMWRKLVRDQFVSFTEA